MPFLGVRKFVILYSISKKYYTFVFTKRHIQIYDQTRLYFRNLVGGVQ